MSLNVQNQIRNNANDIRNYVEELYSWEDDIEKKNQAKKNNQNEEALKQIPIRGKADEVSSQESAANKTSSDTKGQKKEDPKKKTIPLQRDANTIQDYYAAWDQYDVDKELAEIQNQHKIQEEEQRKQEINRQYNPYENYVAPAQRATPNTKIVFQGGKAPSSDAVSFQDQGNLYYQSSDYEKAVDMYTQGLEKLDSLKQNSEQITSLRVNLFSNRAMAYLQLKQYLLAEQDTQEALQMDEKHIKSLCRLGTALKQQQKLKEALSIFNQVQALEANNDDALRQSAILTQQINQLQQNANDRLNLPTKTKAPETYQSVNVIDTQNDILEIEQEEEEEEVDYENNQFTRIREIDRQIGSGDVQNNDDIFDDDQTIMLRKTKHSNNNHTNSSNNSTEIEDSKQGSEKKSRHGILKNREEEQEDEFYNNLKDIDGKLIRHHSMQETEEIEDSKTKQIAFKQDSKDQETESYHRPQLNLYPTHHILKNSTKTKPAEFKNLKEIDMTMSQGQTSREKLSPEISEIGKQNLKFSKDSKDEVSQPSGSDADDLNSENDQRKRAITFGSEENLQKQRVHKYDPQRVPRRGSLQLATMPFVQLNPNNNQDNSPGIPFDHLRNIEGKFIQNEHLEENRESPVKRERKVSFERASNESSQQRKSSHNNKAYSSGHIKLKPAIKIQKDYKDDPLLNHLQNVDGQILKHKKSTEKTTINLEKMNTDSDDQNGDSSPSHKVKFGDVLMEESQNVREKKDRKQRGSILKNAHHSNAFQEILNEKNNQESKEQEARVQFVVKTKENEEIQISTALNIPDDAEIEKFNLISFTQKWSTFKNHPQQALILLSKINSNVLKDSIFKEGVDVTVFKQIMNTLGLDLNKQRRLFFGAFKI